MKYIYLAFFIVFPVFLNAQPYFNDGATWYYGMWPNDTTSYIRIEKTGETWIGGKYCDELKFSEYNFQYSSQPFVYYRYTVQSGDSVLIYKTHNATFGVLYDFSAHAGDTISCSYCTTGWVVDSIGQLELPMATLNKQYSHVGVHQFITYEKIGHTGYFIPWFDMTSPMLPGWQLRCYQDNEGLYLHTGQSESCDDGDSAHAETDIEVMSGYYGVSVISNSIVPGTEVTIYDASGRIVASEYASQNKTCYVELQLDARGLYLATIRNGQDVISEKFVLINPWY